MDSVALRIEVTEMKNQSLRKIVVAALLAALVCVATIVVTVPSPMDGFVNLGDGIVLLAGWLLGPLYGFLSAGLGSALADLLLGYYYYAPGTFLIKGLSALLAAYIIAALGRLKMKKTVGALIASCAAEIEMVLGYFGYAAIFCGKGFAAAASIPGNVVQGIFGIAIFLALYTLFGKYRWKERLI